MIDPESVEQVRQAADLVELLRGRVELRRRSGRWWANCPFHDESTPSFSILPDGRHYHCFGCGVSGDAITWMREREGAASFGEAVEALADRFGVELRYQQASPQEEAARAAGARRLQLLGRACDFYAAYLWKADEAQAARTYLTERGFDEDLLRRYRVGYAPGAGAVLAQRALQEGYTRRDLVEAGLARRDGGDFFTSRIIFPICDARGRVQGFGGRTLDPNERAKYVNSAEGPTFRKRRLLFALDLARAAASKQGWVAVAEGYTDVLSLAKAGLDNAVACMGTSLTSDQFRLLARTADEVRLCFDGDRAGQEAAWRSVEAADGIAVRLSAVPLPVGSDPGDLAASVEGLDRLRVLVEHPEPMLSYLVRSRIARAGRTAQERGAALDDVEELLRRFPDNPERTEAVRLAASLLELTQSQEERLLRGARATGNGGGTPREDAAARLGADEVRERRFLAMAAALPDQGRKWLGTLSEDAFDLPVHRRAFGLLVGGEPLDRWSEDMQELAIELQAVIVNSPEEWEIREAAYRLGERHLDRQIQAARAAGDDAEYLRLLKLLKSLREARRHRPSD